MKAGSSSVFAKTSKILRDAKEANLKVKITTSTKDLYGTITEVFDDEAVVINVSGDQTIVMLRAIETMRIQ